MKFGGSSIDQPSRIKAISQKIITAANNGSQVVVVLSAMAGETDRLLSMANQLVDVPEPRELDMLLATGEQVSIALLSMLLIKVGYPAKSYTASQLGLLTDKAHTKAEITNIKINKVCNDLQLGKIVVIAGFQGVDSDGNITTLGRGGSDTTAVALAAVLQADECQIYTDVDGLYTADPKIEPCAQKIAKIYFDQMLALTESGAKILQIKAAELAGKYQVPLRILSSKDKGTGTLIVYNKNSISSPVISGITYDKNIAKLALKGVVNQPGVAGIIFKVMADAAVNIDLMTHAEIAANQPSIDLCFTVTQEEYPRAVQAIQSLNDRLNIKEICGNTDIVKISLVGIGVGSNPAIVTKMFTTLGNYGINLQMISSSDTKVSVVVDEKYLELGVKKLHAIFDLESVIKQT